VLALFPRRVLPPLAHGSPLQGSALLGVRFSLGEPILRLELRQMIFHLPRALRPRPTLAVICGGESPASGPLRTTHAKMKPRCWPLR
jgi:hypothetical protein